MFSILTSKQQENHRSLFQTQTKIFKILTIFFICVINKTRKGVLYMALYIDVDGKEVKVPKIFEYVKTKIDFPQASIYVENAHGYFGDYRIIDSSKYQKNNKIDLKDFCFGPFIDFDRLKGSEIFSVDDFFVQYTPGTQNITVWDHNEIDNRPRQINWLNREDKQQPIVFEPVLCLNGVPQKVYPVLSKNQSVIENHVFNAITKIGFDRFPGHVTDQRFFKFVPSKTKTNFDSGVLFKREQDSFEWILIDSANIKFTAYSFYKGTCIQARQFNTSVELIKHLEFLKQIRDIYLVKTYGRQP